MKHFNSNLRMTISLAILIIAGCAPKSNPTPDKAAVESAWKEATKGAFVGEIDISVKKVTTSDAFRVRANGESTAVVIGLTNHSKTKVIRFDGWRDTAKLEDEHGNKYEQLSIPDNVLSILKNLSGNDNLDIPMHPGKSYEITLLFEPLPERSTELRLTLPANAIEGVEKGPIRLKVPTLRAEQAAQADAELARLKRWLVAKWASSRYSVPGFPNPDPADPTDPSRLFVEFRADGTWTTHIYANAQRVEKSGTWEGLRVEVGNLIIKQVADGIATEATCELTASGKLNVFDAKSGFVAASKVARFPTLQEYQKARDDRAKAVAVRSEAQRKAEAERVEAAKKEEAEAEALWQASDLPYRQGKYPEVREMLKAIVDKYPTTTAAAKASALLGKLPGR